MAVKYTLSFSTDTGSDIEWELDILDTSFDGTATKLKGQPSPIEIEWKKDRDVYQPVIGSKASINLLLEDGDVLDDFNSFAEYTYEVRLRYKDTDDNLQDFWKGWIEPNDGNEQFASYPYPVSYVATDHLNKLDRAIRKPNTRGNVNIVYYILDALETTGLGLDVYIDSSMRDSTDTDALTTVKVNELAFIDSDTSKSYGDNGTNASTKREALEGILTAFNCSVRQSKGRFYVVNNSLHDSNAKTWKVYDFTVGANANKIEDTNYVAGTDVTETLADLTYEFDSSSTTALRLRDEQLFLIPRLPLGSVECAPADLRPINTIVNPNFDNDGAGWEVDDDSVDQTLTFSASNGLSDSGQSIFTNRSRSRNTATQSNIWFRTDADDAEEMSRDSSYNFQFDWKSKFIDSDIIKTNMAFRISARFTSNITLTYLRNEKGNIDYYNNVKNSAITQGDIVSNEIYYNFEEDKWYPFTTDLLTSERGSYYKIASVEESDAWFQESLQLKSIGKTVSGPTTTVDVPNENPTFHITFFYPQAVDKIKNNGVNLVAEGGITNIETYIDNFRAISNNEDTDPPFFERVQTDYTKTQQYEPNIIGSPVLDAAYYEILDTTAYWEEGQDVDVASSRTLEQIITNQKLKDWQEQFYYWESEFINNTTTPMSFVNVINLDTTITDASTDSSCIINGGTFNPKMNTYQLGMYTPNQTTELDFGDFYEENVTLLHKDVPDRVFQKRTTIGIVYEAIDDDGNAVADGITGDMWITSGLGDPNSQREFEFFISPASDKEIDGLPEVLDTDAKPAPEFFTNINFEKIGANVRCTGTLTISDEAEWEEMYIQATVDDLVGTNSRTIFSATDSMTGATLAEGTGQITELGPVGQTERFIYHIQPTAGNQMLASALTVTLNSVKDGDSATDTDVSGVINGGDILKIQQGNGVDVIVPFSYSDTSPVYAKLTFSGTAIAITQDDAVTVTINATEAGSETDDWSIQDSSIVLSGNPGDSFTAIFEINPESGKYVDAGSITLGSIEESWLGDYNKVSSQQASSEALVFLHGTFPTSNSTANITINVNVLDPASTTAVAHTYTWTTGTGYFFNNASNNYSASLEEGEVASFTMSMEANSGSKLGTVNLSTKVATYDVSLGTLPTGLSLESTTPYHTNGVIEQIDFNIKVTGQATSQSGTIPFTGNAGTQDDLYTFRYNVEVDTSKSFNGVLNTGFIDVTFGDADLGDSIDGTHVFTVTSIDPVMVYNSVNDIIVTPASGYAAAKSISGGVITVTLTGNFPSTAPTTGLAEVLVTVSGEATAVTTATSGSFDDGATRSVNAGTDTHSIPVTTNGTWGITSPSPSWVFLLGHAGNGDSPSGFAIITLLANNTGSDRSVVLTLRDGTNVTDTALDTITLTQKAEFSIESVTNGSNAQVQGIWIGTQAQFNVISGTDSDNTLYLISS